MKRQYKNQRLSIIPSSESNMSISLTSTPSSSDMRGAPGAGEDERGVPIALRVCGRKDWTRKENA